MTTSVLVVDFSVSHRACAATLLVELPTTLMASALPGELAIFILLYTFVNSFPLFFIVLVFRAGVSQFRDKVIIMVCKSYFQNYLTSFCYCS